MTIKIKVAKRVKQSNTFDAVIDQLKGIVSTSKSTTIEVSPWVYLTDLRMHIELLYPQLTAHTVACSDDGPTTLILKVKK